MKRFFTEMKLSTKIIAAVVIVLVIASAALCAMAYDSKIYKGVSVGGTDIGGMSAEEAKNALSSTNYFGNRCDFVCEGREFSVSVDAIDLGCDIDKTVEEAVSYGKDGNVFSRIANVFSLMSAPVSLPVEVTYNEEKLDSVFTENIGDLCTPTEAPQSVIEGDKLCIINGSDGLGINKASLRRDFAEVAEGKKEKVELIIETVNPTPVSAKSLHNEYYKEVVNADYSISNLKITYTESVDGVDFDIAEAEKIIEENLKNPREYYIPLKITKPEKTVESLDKELFGDCLGTYTSKYNPGEIGRTKNVTLAARHINNVVLKTGDVFSYNNIVGERTEARGFAGAKVYSGGNVVDGLGGGICQVSSTLYNAVLFADLEIVARTCHSLPVTYVPLGRDATVSYGVIDFKFKNQYEKPVKVSSSIGGGTLTISIYGTKTSDKKVELSTETLSTIPFTEVEQPDEAIAVGETKVKQSGSNGAIVNTYKKVTENGKVISNKMIHKSVYNPINKIILVPPAAVQPAPGSGELPSVPNPNVQLPSNVVIPGEQLPSEQPPEEVPSGAVEQPPAAEAPGEQIVHE